MVLKLDKHAKWTAIALLVLFVLLACLYCRRPSPHTTAHFTNHFPLEIVGPPGAVSKTWTVWSSKPGKIWLLTHNITSDEKVSVRLNGGPWYQIANSNAWITGSARLYGGIGSAWMGAMSLTLKEPLACAGENRLQFRLDHEEGISSTARILEARVIDDDTNSCHPLLSTQQVWVEEGPWTAWDTTPEALARGSNLYHHAILTDRWGGTNLPAGVSCSACHWSDGGDTTYFGFSPDSIIGRSIFHGLSTNEGRDIANYVYATSMHPRRGRPWNPTFQPGPGMSTVDPQAWMAGAGMQWVLPADSNSWAYIPRWQNFTNYIPQQEIPVATPFPDANAWLAVAHPYEYWGTNNALINDLIVYSKTFLETTTKSNFRDKGNSYWNKMSAVDSGALQGITDTVDRRAQMACVGVRQLYIWKFIEVIQRLGLWDDGTLIQDNRTARCIPHIRVGIFGVAAHFRAKAGDRQHNPRYFWFRKGSPVEWSVSSHQWYLLAISINGAIPRNGFSPIDFPYLEAFAEAQMKQGIPSTAQMWIAMFYYGVSGVATPHTSGDSWALYLDGRQSYLGHTPNYMLDTWEGYSPEDRNAYIEQFARAWMPWPTHFGQQYFITNDLREVSGNETGDPDYASAATDRHLEVLTFMKEFKINPEIIEEYTRIGERLWPGCDWRDKDMP